MLLHLGDFGQQQKGKESLLALNVASASTAIPFEKIDKEHFLTTSFQIKKVQIYTSLKNIELFSQRKIKFENTLILCFTKKSLQLYCSYVGSFVFICW